MSESNAALLIHIGPIREESQRIMQNAALPTFIAALEQKPHRLKSLKNSLSSVFVSNALITVKGGEALVYEYNLPELNGFSPASGLKKLYPGLVEKHRYTLETQTLDAALDVHQLRGTPITQLIIEQVENACQLVQHMEAQGLLQALAKLWVRTSPERLYADMPTQPELLATCEQLGFEIVDTQADDPDFVLVEFKRNPLYSEYKKLQEKVTKLEQQEKEQTAANEKAQSEIAQLKQAHEKLAQQHAEQKKVLERAEHDVAECQKQNEQLKKARDESAATKEKAQAEISQLKQEREKLTKQQDTLREQLREQRQSNQTLDAEMQATLARQNKLAIELERAEAQLDLIKDLLLKDKLLQR